MIGRRGITQAAFNTKEMRELTSVDNLQTYMVQSEVNDSMTDASRTEALERAYMRRNDFLAEKFTQIESAEQYEDIMSRKNEKKLILRFLRSPTELIADPITNRISGVTLQKMALEGAPRKQRAVEASSDDEAFLRDFKCDVLIKSIGYRSQRLLGVPFDEKKCVIPHEYGCVQDPVTK